MHYIERPEKEEEGEVEWSIRVVLHGYDTTRVDGFSSKPVHSEQDPEQKEDNSIITHLSHCSHILSHSLTHIHQLNA